MATEDQSSKIDLVIKSAREGAAGVLRMECAASGENFQYDQSWAINGLTEKEIEMNVHLCRAGEVS